jgi:hypothetical protein
MYLPAEKIPIMMVSLLPLPLLSPLPPSPLLEAITTATVNNAATISIFTTILMFVPLIYLA